MKKFSLKGKTYMSLLVAGVTLFSGLGSAGVQAMSDMGGISLNENDEKKQIFEAPKVQSAHVQQTSTQNELPKNRCSLDVSSANVNDNDDKFEKDSVIELLSKLSSNPQANQNQQVHVPVNALQDDVFAINAKNVKFEKDADNKKDDELSMLHKKTKGKTRKKAVLSVNEPENSIKSRLRSYKKLKSDEDPEYETKMAELLSLKSTRQKKLDFMKKLLSTMQAEEFVQTLQMRVMAAVENKLSRDVDFKFREALELFRLNLNLKCEMDEVVDEEHFLGWFKRLICNSDFSQTLRDMIDQVLKSVNLSDIKDQYQNVVDKKRLSDKIKKKNLGKINNFTAQDWKTFVECLANQIYSNDGSDSYFNVDKCQLDDIIEIFNDFDDEALTCVMEIVEGEYDDEMDPADLTNLYNRFLNIFDEVFMNMFLDVFRVELSKLLAEKMGVAQ